MDSGSLFALKVSAPRAWNLASHGPELVVAGESVAHVVQIYSKNFREKLLGGAEGWVFIAQALGEESEVLYAFETPLERALFLELWNLDAVGPKLAALILSAFTAQDLRAGCEGIPLPTVKVAGLGPKNIEKLKGGLKARAEHFEKLFVTWNFKDLPRVGGTCPDEVMAALVKLGLRPGEIAQL